MVLALSVALALDIAATVLGALVHEGPRGIVDCSTGPCTYYYERGWPLEWKTNAPGWLTAVIQDNGGNFAYGENGVAELMFILTVIMWFVVALIAEAVVALIGPLVWRFIRRQPIPSP